jgi:hypothetical protein
VREQEPKGATDGWVAISHDGADVGPPLIVTLSSVRPGGP